MSRSRGYTYNYGGGGNSPYLSTNIQKLFSERIRVFGEVEFTKLSVVTGVIKIALKVLNKLSFRFQKLTLVVGVSIPYSGIVFTRENFR